MCSSDLSSRNLSSRRVYSDLNRLNSWLARSASRVEALESEANHDSPVQDKAELTSLNSSTLCKGANVWFVATDNSTSLLSWAHLPPARKPRQVGLVIRWPVAARVQQTEPDSRVPLHCCAQSSGSGSGVKQRRTVSDLPRRPFQGQSIAFFSASVHNSASAGSTSTYPLDLACPQWISPGRDCST